MLFRSKEEVLKDYRVACESREVSYIGRQDVFRGRAKFGVFGDGKELAQIAMSKVFRKGDFRSGYYRDQTFLAAVQGQTIGKHDLGYGLVMYFYEYYVSAGPLLYRAFVLHFVILAAILFTVLIFAYRKNILNQSSFTLLLYFLLTLLNPRLKVYDIFPALAALFIFISFHQSTLSRWIFVFAYTLSLSQLTDTPLFAHHGLLADPLNVYYLTMGLIFIGTLFSLKPSPEPALKN